MKIQYISISNFIVQHICHIQTKGATTLNDESLRHVPLFSEDLLKVVNTWMRGSDSEVLHHPHTA